MIYSLTSLRFLFAFIVFLSHINIANYFPNLMQLFWEGFIGVGFFFMLSGFILSYNYKEKILNGFSFRKFYLARFARVYPTHFLLLIIALFIVNKDQSLFFHHLFLIQSWFPEKSVYFSLNAPSWSIATEAFFYAAFPILILLKRKIFIIVSILALTVIGFNLFLPNEYKHYFLYINPLMRLSEFSLGIVLYEIYLKIKNKRERIETDNFELSKVIYFKKDTLFEISAFIILGLFIFMVFYAKIPLSYRYSIYYWIPMMLLLLTFSLSQGFFAKLLSTKWFVYFGEASFSFYLIHYFVIKNIIIGNSIIHSIVTFLISLILSCLCFSFFEKPLNKFIRNFPVRYS
ncbi:acyltransferase family protein [Ursidibacter arcticus]